jgi:hypothetical protein
MRKHGRGSGVVAARSPTWAANEARGVTGSTDEARRYRVECLGGRSGRARRDRRPDGTGLRGSDRGRIRRLGRDASLVAEMAEAPVEGRRSSGAVPLPGAGDAPVPVEPLLAADAAMFEMQRTGGDRRASDSPCIAKGRSDLVRDAA